MMSVLGDLFVLDCDFFNFAVGGFVTIIEVAFADDVLYLFKHGVFNNVTKKAL